MSIYTFTLKHNLFLFTAFRIAIGDHHHYYLFTARDDRNIQTKALLPKIITVMLCALILYLFFVIAENILNEKQSWTNTGKPIDRLHRDQTDQCNVLDFEHDIGLWIRTNFSAQDTWPCCGMNFREYPKECGPVKPEVFWSRAGNRTFYSHTGGSGCRGPCEPTNGSIISAQWTPTNCHLPTFDAAHFCSNVLRKRNLMVIGDSTMGQTATVLMNAVHHYCPEQIRFELSDSLIGRSLGGWY